MLPRDIKEGQQDVDCHLFVHVCSALPMSEPLLSEAECGMLIRTGRFRRNGAAVSSAGALRHSHEVGISLKN